MLFSTKYLQLQRTTHKQQEKDKQQKPRKKQQDIVTKELIEMFVKQKRHPMELLIR